MDKKTFIQQSVNNILTFTEPIFGSIDGEENVKSQMSVKGWIYFIILFVMFMLMFTHVQKFIYSFLLGYFDKFLIYGIYSFLEIIVSVYCLAQDWKK